MLQSIGQVEIDMCYAPYHYRYPEVFSEPVSSGAVHNDEEWIPSEGFPEYPVYKECFQALGLLLYEVELAFTAHPGWIYFRLGSTFEMRPSLVFWAQGICSKSSEEMKKLIFPLKS